MFVTIRHLPQKELDNLNGLSEMEKVQKAKEYFRNNEYIKVADVEMDSNKLQEILDEAVTISTSQEKPWYTKRIPGLFIHNLEEKNKLGCRDTTIGDLIQINGKTFVVLANSFKDISQYN